MPLLESCEFFFTIYSWTDPKRCSFNCILTINALFTWLINHQPAVLFSHNKPPTETTAVLFSQKRPAPAISHQPPVNRTDQVRSTINSGLMLAISEKKLFCPDGR
jgi:hypothetical protein